MQGFSTEGLSEAELGALQCHYMFLEDWSRGVGAEDNAVLMSLPSVADPSLAPPGHMVLHAYTPATERFDRWEGLERGTPEYEQLKVRRLVAGWGALSCIITLQLARLLAPSLLTLLYSFTDRSLDHSLTHSLARSLTLRTPLSVLSPIWAMQLSDERPYPHRRSAAPSSGAR